MSGRTYFDKVWDDHVVARLAGGRDLIYIDRHFVHELSSRKAFDDLDEKGRKVASPERTFAVCDHIVSTEPDRDDGTVPGGEALIRALRRSAARHDVSLFDVNDARQGIVHVVAPELGLVLPGLTFVCGDSHSCTVGGIGALGWGIGTAEIEHVLATQTLPQRRPKTMRITLEGRLDKGVTAKDVVLAIIARHGVSAGTGYAVEFAGPPVRRMSVEARMTLCNMTIEFGGRIGFVAPDDTTLTYVAARPAAPRGQDLDAAIAYWRALSSDDDAVFDHDITFASDDLTPQITIGTTPGDAIPVTAAVPDPSSFDDPARRRQLADGLQYLGLEPGQPVAEVPVDRVFIGSCANARIEDLRAAARILDGRKVADGVRVMIVPGSQPVKSAAEAEGLDRIFLQAGCEWRQPGCSMCPGLNGDFGSHGERVVSTSNRNFEGRQGKGVRTHLASPFTAAATAVAGTIADPRPYLAGSAT